MSRRRPPPKGRVLFVTHTRKPVKVQRVYRPPTEFEAIINEIRSLRDTVLGRFSHLSGELDGAGKSNTALLASMHRDIEAIGRLHEGTKLEMERHHRELTNVSARLAEVSMQLTRLLAKAHRRAGGKR